MWRSGRCSNISVFGFPIFDPKKDFHQKYSKAVIVEHKVQIHPVDELQGKVNFHFHKKKLFSCEGNKKLFIIFFVNYLSGK